MADDDALRATVLQGVMSALAGQIVTFGITHTRAETASQGQ